MNYTTSDYLEQLEQDREDLVDNLETKGITGLTGDETFTQLVPKVLDIQSTPDTTDLRTVINMTDVNLTSQTPFGDYPDGLYNGYINVLKNKYILADNMNKDTSSGVINEGSGLPIYNFKLTKESTQSGTPTPISPEEINTVKGISNLLPPDINSYTKDGLTITKNDDNTYTIKGRSQRSSSIEFTTKSDYFTIPAGTYTSFTNLNNGRNFIYMRKDSGEYETLSDDTSDSKTITLNEDKQYNRIYLYVNGAGEVFDDVIKLTLVEGTQKPEYTPYGEKYIRLSITGNNTKNIILPLDNNELVGKNDNLDKYIVDKYGNCYIEKVFAKIDSYNGETITTDYWSTTGGLDTGATIYYVLDTPQLIDLNYTADLTLYEGTNTITNNESADMEITYIKDTYE